MLLILSEWLRKNESTSFQILKCFLTLIFSFYLKVFATEIYEPFQSIRQMGMGGVYIFNEEDAGSMIQNPALLCETKGFNATFLNVQLGVGDLKDYLDMTNSGTSQLSDSLTDYYGKNIWLNTNGFIALSLPCFGLAGVYNGTASFYLHNPAYPELVTFYQTDYGAVIGGGFQLPGGVSLGMNVKRVTRKGGPLIYGAPQIANLAQTSDISSLVSTDQNEGVGYGFDFGASTRWSFLPFNPTLSLAWRDVELMWLTDRKSVV